MQTEDAVCAFIGKTAGDVLCEKIVWSLVDFSIQQKNLSIQQKNVGNVMLSWYNKVNDTDRNKLCDKDKSSSKRK